jgi:beta-1,4-mannosyltransferase
MMRVLAWPMTNRDNPYVGLLYKDMAADVAVEPLSASSLLRHYDVWHLHWPESLLNIPGRWRCAYKLVGLFVLLTCLRLRGTRVVWTMHNLKAHEALHPRLEALFWRHFIPRVDGLISMSQTALRMGVERFPRLAGVPHAVIPHGHYRDAYPTGSAGAIASATHAAARPKVILFFGAVRAYKNVEALLEVFHGLHDPEASLRIVGRPNSPALTETVRTYEQRDSRIHARLEYVSAEGVSTELAAAHLVVLPYRSILNSGSALLVLSLNRPVLVPAMGAMNELAADFGPDWVRTYQEPLTTSILAEALDWAMAPRPETCPVPTRYEWESIRAETVRLYRQSMAPHREAHMAREEGLL